ASKRPPASPTRGSELEAAVDVPLGVVDMSLSDVAWLPGVAWEPAREEAQATAPSRRMERRKRAAGRPPDHGWATGVMTSSFMGYG
ncbi:MAG: hypothetical protein ACRD21_03695, partial [Vicinamibacteria bacterium]